jgi:hypothetical protein
MTGILGNGAVTSIGSTRFDNISVMNWGESRHGGPGSIE